MSRDRFGRRLARLEGQMGQRSPWFVVAIAGPGESAAAALDRELAERGTTRTNLEAGDYVLTICPWANRHLNPEHRQPVEAEQ